MKSLIQAKPDVTYYNLNETNTSLRHPQQLCIIVQWRNLKNSSWGGIINQTLKYFNMFHHKHPEIQNKYFQ